MSEEHPGYERIDTAPPPAEAPPAPATVKSIMQNTEIGMDDATGEITFTAPTENQPAAGEISPPQATLPTDLPGGPVNALPTPGHDFEKRFKDTQGALTKANQDLSVQAQTTKALELQIAELSGQLQQLNTVAPNQDTPPTPVSPTDLVDPETGNLRLDRLTEYTAQQVTAQVATQVAAQVAEAVGKIEAPQSPMDPKVAMHLTAGYEAQQEIRAALEKYPDFPSRAHEVAQISEKYPRLSVSEAYDLLVSMKPTPDVPAPPATGQPVGEAVTGVPPAPQNPGLDDLRERAARLQTEQGVAGAQPVKGHATTIREATNEAMEELHLV